MKKALIVLGVILAGIAVIAVIAGSWVLGTYNTFARNEQVVEESWAQVESQYQRRFDLIPGVVDATKGILRQEQAVFGAIADARRNYASAPAGSNKKVQATSQMEGALARLLVVMENYPQLNSNVNVQAMVDELAGTENRINVARDRYNTQVAIWNKEVVTMPKGLLANLFGFDERDFFKSEEGAAQRVDTNLSL